MPKLKEQPKWVTDLREDIREQQRFGWSVREKKGSVEVIRYWADTGKRQSAVLPIAWRRENKREILNALHGINAALNKGLSLKDAVKLNFEVAAGPKPTTNWMEIYQRFKDFKVLNGKTKDSTFNKNYRPRLEQLIDTLNSEDGPSNGNVAIEAMRFNRQGEGEPGTRGRKLRIEYSVQFLRFAVSTCGASRRWLPTDKVIADSIGDRLRTDDAKQAPNAGQAVFLTDEQIVRLYESIKDDRWRRAVGLLSIFGLRGVELLYCRPGTRQGEGPLTGLHVHYVKHTAKGSTEPRFVKPCSPVGMDISQELLTELALERSLGRSGLPPLGSSDGAVSSAISTYLRRNPIWMEYKAKAREAGLGRVSVYSFRHAFAARAAGRAIPPRSVAYAMGHAYGTHVKTYSRQLDLDGADDNFEAAETKAFSC